VNERIRGERPVSWTEMPHADVKSRKDVMQFFGDKYGETVRVVQIGGKAGGLDGYSMELCGGTHTRATGEIGCSGSWVRTRSPPGFGASKRGGIDRLRCDAGDRELIRSLATGR
jgi:Ser-tRNA(Ala) deacylase AlaX